MKTPLVSVIVPCFNSEAHIAETIESVLAQTYKNVEIIVVDDGSTDNTREIVTTYASHVRLVCQRNSGVCSARNNGLKEALGEFVCFMDHDDYWYPEKLSRQIDTFSEHPKAGAVYTSFLVWNADQAGVFPPPGSFVRESIPDTVDPEYSGWIYHHFLMDCWMLTSTAMFRKSTFSLCGGAFDENLPYSEDWELWLRMSRHVQMIKLMRPSTLYRQHAKQGNRTVRSIDYRTNLLTETAQKWGLNSKDGRHVEKRQFLNQLATYHAGFALSHLTSGSLFIAIKSFAKAWACSPLRIKYLAYIPAALLGWKPR
jgi:glycosyltransferase involved in cell wall biosynthesis